MGVSAPMVVSICSRYLSYDIGGGDWKHERDDGEGRVTVKQAKFPREKGGISGTIVLDLQQ